MVLLMDVQIATGTRISELLRLEARDITRHQEGNRVWCEITLRDTKNGEARVTPIPVELGDRLKDLVERGMPHYASIRRAMRFARKTVGLPLTQPTHAHRHTTATRLTQRGVPTSDVKDYLGHKTLATTLRYIQADTRSKRRAMDALTATRSDLQ
jgi:integrase